MGFVASEQMVAVAVTAETFRTRPSELLAITDPVVALNLDMAAAAVLGREMEKATDGPSPGVKKVYL